MPDPAPNANPDITGRGELLRSLGHLARGLSALFWGLPTLLIVSVRTAKADWLAPWALVPVLALSGLLLVGLWHMGSFQRQERPWRAALDRAKLLGLVNLGLTPFLFWWNRVPEQPFFAVGVFLLALTGVLFLFNLNLVLARLGAMLPDETLRHETKQFTAFNRGLLLALLLLTVLYLGFTQLPRLPVQLQVVALILDRGGHWALVFLVLLPLAMTMALIWKTKEVILDSVFGEHR
jgi:hypothetical protein